MTGSPAPPRSGENTLTVSQSSGSAPGATGADGPRLNADCGGGGPQQAAPPPPPPRRGGPRRGEPQGPARGRGERERARAARRLLPPPGPSGWATRGRTPGGPRAPPRAGPNPGKDPPPCG